MSGSATGYYLERSSWLHRRHPTTKLVGLLFVLVSAFLLPPVALVALATGLVVVAALAGLLMDVVRSLLIPAVLVASIVLVNALFFPGGTDIVARLGPLAMTGEGLTFGLVSAGRLLVVYVAAALLLFTTLADDLLESLVRRGVSHRIAFVVLSAVQLVPGMRDRAATVLTAQQARGLDLAGSPVRRARHLLPLVSPVLLGALIDVRERTLALEARGFGARPGRTAYRVVPDPPRDRVIRVALLAATAVVIAVAVLGAVAPGAGR